MVYDTLQRMAFGNAWRGLLLAVLAAAPLAASADDAITPREAGPPGASSKAGNRPIWNSGSPAERVPEREAPNDASENPPAWSATGDGAKSSERKPPENRPLVTTRPEDERVKESTKD